jgi:hypothetical protein
MIVGDLTYRYRGARAMVILHERQLRRFLKAWKTARARGAQLPETTDPDYESLDTLLRHVFRWARRYMIWMCAKLELADPEIRQPPDPAAIGTECDGYLEHLLDRWRTPLAPVPEERFHRPQYPAPWNVSYCVDAMLEHAVMHPLRHRFQLMELME